LSIKQDRKKITDFLNDKNIEVFGATTAGEFIDGNCESGSIAVLLLEMDTTYFKILFEDYRGKDPINVANRLGQKSLQEFSNPVFIVCYNQRYVIGW
jgi:hypothetical protein